MHLNFDTTPSKPGKTVVQDESGNKNDAGLANGAEISNRTMGMVTRAHKKFLEAFFSNVAGFRKARRNWNHLFCIGFNSNLIIVEKQLLQYGQWKSKVLGHLR